MNEQGTYYADPCTIFRLDPPRPLLADESSLLEYLLLEGLAQTGISEKDLTRALVTEVHDNCPTFDFKIVGVELPKEVRRNAALLTGVGRDADGMMFKMLFIFLGHDTFEVEFFRGDVSPFLSKPQPTQIQIMR